VTVGGVVYGHYVYQLNGQADGLNNFDISRAYINVNGRFDDIGSRVTGDIYRVADGSLSYRLKYAYVTFNPGAGPYTLKFGQIQTPWVDHVETLWDYRMQGTVAVDRNGFLSSSDFGIGVDGRWSGERVNAGLVLINGESYSRAPGDKRKDLAARASFRLAETNDNSRVGGLRLSVLAHFGTPTDGGLRNRVAALLSYRTQRVTFGAELGTTRDSVTTTPAPARTGRVMSVFGVYRVPNSRAALIGRVDFVDPNTATANNRQTRVIAGASYQLRPNLRLLVDVDHLTYEGGAPTPALEAVRSQALFQVQVNF